MLSRYNLIRQQIMFRGFDRDKQTRHNVKKQNYNKERNEVKNGNSLRVGREFDGEWSTMAYRDFLRKEYGVKVDRYVAGHYMSNRGKWDRSFLTEPFSKKWEREKHLGNVTNEDLHYLKAEASHQFEKTCNHDDMQHHDRTRWQKNKISSKARNKERRNKVASGSAFHDNVV